MTLTKVRLQRFTAFSDFELEFSPGINVFVGANGTGKTHLMKVCYAACDVAGTGRSFSEKLVRVFMPSNLSLGRLVKRRQGQALGIVEVHRGKRRLQASFSTRMKRPASAVIKGDNRWGDSEMRSVYIPVKEMLSNAPGFSSLYAAREIHFEEVYADILERAYLPALRGPMDESRRRLLRELRKAIEGRVTITNEEFFLSNRQGNLEFSLLAEGMRKLGLLWHLIQNGVLQSGTVLFWDEPETNLNPKMFGAVIDVLLELQREGVQIFFATHDYVILEELDLRKTAYDKVAFHSLYRDDTGDIACNTASDYLDISPNAIADTFTDLYDRTIERSLKGVGGR